jgi:cysteine-rich repeat protein
MLAICCSCSTISGLDDFGVDDAVPKGGGGEGGMPMGSGGSAAGGFAAGGNVGMGGVGGGAADCGDGTISGGEECDDGNQDANDGCDASCVVECTRLKDPATFHCYEYFSADLQFGVARDSCLALGANWDLAALSSQSELNFIIASGVVSSDCWIGGIDMADNNQFAWLKNEPWGFEQWTAGEPDHDGNCIKLDPFVTPLGFSDKPCQDFDDTLCELTPAGS